MSSAIQRLMISSCRSKIDIYRRIIPNLSILRERKAVIRMGYPVYYTCMIHERLFLNSIICLEEVNPKENGIGIIDNISTFQIKKRPSRRNRIVIDDDKIPKLNAWTVKALATAEEYNLETLTYGLLDQQLYIPDKISTSTSRSLC